MVTLNTGGIHLFPRIHHVVTLHTGGIRCQTMATFYPAIYGGSKQHLVLMNKYLSSWEHLLPAARTYHSNLDIDHCYKHVSRNNVSRNM